jgi:filamentous hemagglutinin family protein
LGTIAIDPNQPMKASLWLTPNAIGSVLLTAHIASAQTYQPSNRIPIADDTLGTQVSGTNNNFAITGGLNRGQNLFHSFQDFSVPTNGIVTFTNPVGNQSIITRVTGNLGSDINGTINSQGANFLLINPNGIVFGPNTQLNVGRVFAASTANAIDLVDGAGRTISFGTNQNGDAPLLSVNPNVLFDVSRFNFTGGNAGISNFGTLQTINPSQYIGLIGGNIAIDGGQINAPGGRIELGGLSAPGQIGFSTVGTNASLSFLTNVTRSNVSLTNQSTVNVAGAGNGDITVNARNIDILGDSLLRGGIERGLGMVGSVAGDIQLDATGRVNMDANSAIANSVRTNSQGQGGNIIVNADMLSLRERATIQALTLGRGNTGDIRVTAAGTIDITGKNTSINTLVGADAIGNGGNMTIDTGSLSLSDGATLAAVTIGRGNAGNIAITAKNDVSLTAADIASTMEGIGNGGNITIATNTFNLRNGATLAAATFGRGDAGNVTVIARDAVALAGKNTGISTNLEPGANGKGGNIAIDARSVSLADGAQLIAANNAGVGNAGNVAVRAKDAVSLTGDNTRIFSTVEAGGVGTGGNISIDAGAVSLADGAQLRALTRGTGDAGNVSVKSRQAVNLTGQRTAIIDTIEAGGVGKGGNISIDAGSVLLTNGSFLTSSNNGTGDAGNIDIKATGSVDIIGIQSNDLVGGIASVASNRTTGNSGNISIDARSFLLQDSASLLAANLGQGNSGRIEITTTDAVRLSGAGGLFVTTASNLGTGGDIDINSRQITLDNRTRINADSVSGNGGNIRIGSPTTDLLLLRRGANVATNASGTPQQGGNGGNIDIIATLIVAVPLENSDITANAIKGIGGNVTIKSQGLFGIDFRPQQTRNSDITASSEFGQSGKVGIETPGIDPGKDLSELPAVPTDASQQISQTCNPERRDRKLVVTGRGGQQPTADELPPTDVVWLDSRNSKLPIATTTGSTQPFPRLPQPAVGWTIDRGKVTLVAASTEGATVGDRVACPQHN